MNQYPVIRSDKSLVFQTAAFESTYVDWLMRAQECSSAEKFLQVFTKIIHFRTTSFKLLHTES